MKKRKALICAAVASLGILSAGSTVFAANQTYNFELPNTRKVYIADENSVNRKLYAGEEWSLYVTSISFTDSYIGWGMSFVPMTENTWTKAGDAHWRTSTGVSYGTYNSTGGPTGRYCLGARIDDDLTGYGYASGLWNSDSVTF